MGIITSMSILFCLVDVVGLAIALMTTTYVVYKGIRYRYFIFSELVWIFYTIAAIFIISSILLIVPLLWTISLYCCIIAGFFLLMESDSISRESVDPAKQIIYAFLVAAFIFVSITTPDCVYQKPYANGELGIGFNETVMGMWLLNFLMPQFAYLYNIVRMNRQSPRNLKRYSRFYLNGWFIAVILFTIWIITPLNDWVPNLGLLFIGIGCDMMGVVIAQHPKLIFILLPSKTDSLIP